MKRKRERKRKEVRKEVVAERKERLNDTQVETLGKTLEFIKDTIAEKVPAEPLALFLWCNALGIKTPYSADVPREVFLERLDKMKDAELCPALLQLYDLAHSPETSSIISFLKSANSLEDGALHLLAKDGAVEFMLKYVPETAITREDLPKIFEAEATKELVTAFLEHENHIKPDSSWRQAEEKEKEKRQLEEDERVARVLAAALEMEGVDFRDSDLRNNEFHEQNLSGTDFTGSQAQKAKFFSCTLDEALFENVDLQEAEFFTGSAKRAYLNNADLRKAKFTAIDLTGADMAGAKIRGTVFDISSLKTLCSGEKEEGTWLRLRRIVIDAGTQGVKDLQEVNLRNVDLSYVDLRQTILTGQDFKTTVVKETWFDRAAIQSLLADSTVKVDLRGAKCDGADLSGLDLSQWDVRRVTFQGAVMDRAALEPLLEKARKGEVDLRGLNLSRQDLSGLDLRNLDLRGIDFRGANMDGAKTSGAKMEGAIRGRFTSGLQQQRGASQETGKKAMEL